MRSRDIAAVAGGIDATAIFSITKAKLQKITKAKSAPKCVNRKGWFMMGIGTTGFANRIKPSLMQLPLQAALLALGRCQ